ncbi:MAG TPA: MFS transporter, partial [Burkholderiaceae bacterium]|nr:MFS transporter [Burkholderiaceae bacterium]
MNLAALHRAIAVAVLGFASGLPLALTGQALQAWLTVDGLDLAHIGFLSLLGLPYTFKFLWAPLMDRVDIAGLGRRRGWIVLAQVLLAGGLFILSDVSPTAALPLFSALGVGVAFLSASQDVVIDAWRTDVLPARERGMGSSLFVMGYRLAMVLSGGIALIWTDPVNGSGLGWPDVYRIMAALMAVAAVFSCVALPTLAQPPARLVDPDRPPMKRDLVGFAAVLLAVAVGVALTRVLVTPVANAIVAALVGAPLRPGALSSKWADLLALLLGLGLTVPLAAYAARRARFETLLSGLRAYFALPRAASFLGFIVFYKLSDAFAMSLLTPFLLTGPHFAPAEVGLV